MTSLFVTYLKSPVGVLQITCTNTNVIKLNFVKKINKSKENKITLKAKKELLEYFSGVKKIFTVKLQVSGTSFEKKVWKEILKLKLGKTISYKDLARLIKRPRAYRAVANALGKNKIPIFIPCHRVVSAKGLGGYSAGINKKRTLLLHELVDVKFL